MSCWIGVKWYIQSIFSSISSIHSSIALGRLKGVIHSPAENFIVQCQGRGRTNMDHAFVQWHTCACILRKFTWTPLPYTSVIPFRLAYHLSCYVYIQAWLFIKPIHCCYSLEACTCSSLANDHFYDYSNPLLHTFFLLIHLRIPIANASLYLSTWYFSMPSFHYPLQFLLMLDPSWWFVLHESWIGMMLELQRPIPL